MARRTGPVRPVRTPDRSPPRITAPFAITWRQVFAVWLMGTLIVVGASWRVQPQQTEKAGRWLAIQAGVMWAQGLYYGNRYWPSWVPGRVPRPRVWPGYDARIGQPPSPRGPMARPASGTGHASPGAANGRPGAMARPSSSGAAHSPSPSRARPASSRSRSSRPAQESRRPSLSSAPMSRAANRTFGGSSGSRTSSHRSR